MARNLIWDVKRAFIKQSQFCPLCATHKDLQQKHKEILYLLRGCSSACHTEYDNEEMYGFVCVCVLVKVNACVCKGEKE